MKRNIIALLLIVFAFFSAYGQSAEPIDLIVLLNTSSQMNSSYDNVNEYLTGSFLSEFLRLGDTFHLIPFSSSPHLDVARRVSEVGDVETIIARMLLQYPIENGSNVTSALNFAEQYITTLPSRQKKIILVSTGSSDTDNLVAASRQRLSTNNATLDYVQVVPGQRLSNLPVSGRDGRQQTSSPGTSTQTSQQQTEQSTQTVTTPPVTQGETQSSETTQSVATSSSTDSSSTSTSSSTTSSSSASTSSSSSTSASTGTQSTSSSQVGGLSKPVIAVIAILGLLLLGFIIFLATRKRDSGSSPSRGIMGARKKDEEEDLAPFTDHSKDLAQYAAVQSRQRTTPYADRPPKADSVKTPVINPTGPLLLNLFVEDQNTAIGKRNIHSLKSGYSLSIGGGSSDFFIFLVPMPPSIGEIRRNGSQCTFVPKKPKYFPDLGSSELRDCINKTIRVVSDKKYEMRMRFEMYEDPLVALNRVLMSIKVPG